MRLFKGIVIILVSIISVRALDFGLSSIAKSVKDVSVGLVQDAGNLLPSAEELFDQGKQLLAGYPFEFLSNAINKICSAAISSNAITPKITPDIHKMQFQFRTACNKYSFPLLKAEDMWKSPEFDPSKKVVILATGWTTTVNDSDPIDVLSKAYNCRGDVNFVAVDAASYVDTLYTWSALNTEDIGRSIAEGLVKLTDIVPIDRVHLIGHSLGAHIVGYTGRYLFELSGMTVPRITGLDPAKPCFNEGENLSGLMRGDGEFVDVIHTNPGVLGKRDPLGDVDFYPSGLDPLPPGCLTISCAHARAWKYYAETVYPGNEYDFMGTRCTSLTRLRNGRCARGQKIPMGFATPSDAIGNYFLEVNSEPPYGLEADESRSQKMETCGLCQKK